ncbi:MAG: hypothetical protein FJZ01_22905 [Candidatus Sericytochromatia bacterium]|nr:hypothetical protein [Candidatus Tanganyikabacteria bacterium]
MRAKSILNAGLAATIGLLALGAAVEARGATTRLGAFVYDAAARTLRVPWRHAKPRVRMFHEPGHRVAYAEFHGASGKSVLAGKARAQNPRSGMLERIFAAQNRPAAVRLAVRGASRVKLVPHVFGAGDAGEIVFELIDWDAAHGEERRRLRARTYDHNHIGLFSLLDPAGALKVPISGPRPAWSVVSAGDRVRAVEINGPRGIPAFFPGARQLATVPSGRFERIYLARARDGVVRLTVRGREAAPDLNPRLVPQGTSGQGWLLVFDPPPPVAAAPPPPPPVVAPVTAPALAPPAPPVALAPPPPPAAGPAAPELLADLEPEFPSRLMLGGRFLALRETLPDAETAAPITAPQPGELPIAARTLYWRHKVAPTWAAELDVRWWERYQVVDELDRSKRHNRDEGWVRAGISRNLALYGMTQNTWASLEVRGVLVENTKKAILREYLFANSQWYVSPVVGTGVTMPIWGPLSAVAQIQAQPIFSLLEDRIALADGVESADAGALQQLPLMFGAQGEFGLEAVFDRWVARASYKYETFRPFVGDFQSLNSGGLSIGYRY